MSKSRKTQSKTGNKESAQVTVNELMNIFAKTVFFNRYMLNKSADISLAVNSYTIDIDSFLGEKINTNFHVPKRIYRTCLLYAKPCTFDHIEGLEKLKEEGLVTETFITKSKGDEIDGDMRSSNRVGSFIVEAASLGELNERVKCCMNSVGIIDDKGNNVILKPKES